MLIQSDPGPYQFQLIRFWNNRIYIVIFITFICSYLAGLEILVGNFLSFLSSANFFKIIFSKISFSNIISDKQLRSRSGPTFRSGTKTVC